MLNSQNQQNPRIACFVSSHGFGHATRIAAILDSLQKSLPNAFFEIYGNTPEWFWKLNLLNPINFRCVQIETDIGLLQNGPFEHDVKQTCNALKHYLNFSNNSFLEVKQRVTQSKIDLILCDISPMGIVIGDQLKIPSILIENFTWDWIYEEFWEEHPVLISHCLSLQEIFRKATIRIQATPTCQDYPDAVKVNPIFRNCRNPVEQIKMSLGLNKDQDFLLLTTGGITLHKSFIDDFSSTTPVVCTTNQSSMIKKRNLISLPMNSGIHFPDLVRASACVIGKAGYGTICECWGTSTPIQAVYRENFKESEILRYFANSNLKHREISLEDFLNKNWDENFPKNRKNQKKHVTITNGSDQVCHTILNFLKL